MAGKDEEMAKKHGLIFIDEVVPISAPVDKRHELEKRFGVPFVWLCLSWPQPGTVLRVSAKGKNPYFVTVGNEITPRQAMIMLAQ